MKKFISLMLLAVLLLGLVACSNQKSSEEVQKTNTTTEVSKDNNENTAKKDVRENVWEELKENDKERINGTWKDGKVSKVTLNKDMLSEVKDKSYEGKEVYLINFPTKDNFEPNVIAVYADADTFDIIGYALVQ